MPGRSPTNALPNYSNNFDATAGISLPSMKPGEPECANYGRRTMAADSRARAARGLAMALQSSRADDGANASPNFR
eukprot:7008354-Pyramimonas_sp.AAC.1